MQPQLSPLISSEDLYLFNIGEQFQAYRTLGAHEMAWQGEHGVRFAVWAPQAREVRVAGNFNGWDGTCHPLAEQGSTGIWVGFVPYAQPGEPYKYEIVSADGVLRLKADPMARHAEKRPGTASLVPEPDRYVWSDGDWQQRKLEQAPYDRPMLIYEVHLGSWRLDAPEQFRTYAELAEELADYVSSMHYTHIEVLPLTEHPLDASWGYQTTGYYAPTSRYGPPEALQLLVDRCHARGIGVILDWVPGHFCKDDHGLRLFDGTPQYEDADPRRAEKPLWGTLAFDFGKPEVQSFLISSAMYWLDVFHMDGIRVDAVSSMIDLQQDKPLELHTVNRYGGTDSLEALDFLRKLNETVFRYFPGTLMIAEDSSSRPAITTPSYLGGLGFNYKWNMGWMNDVLRYMQRDPSERSAHHSLLTFSLMYTYNENYVLPFSHDEVVHGKRSLLHKMPGSYEEKFAGLRLLYGYWITHPGKKLLFMGSEFGQFDEWKDFASLDWFLLDYPLHAAMHRYSRRLNEFYLGCAALWEQDHRSEGFDWIDVNNADQCILSYVRRARAPDEFAITMLNFSRQAHDVYRIGVPAEGSYRVELNSDSAEYGGAGGAMPTRVEASAVPMHGRSFSIELPLPALTFLLLIPESST